MPDTQAAPMSPEASIADAPPAEPILRFFAYGHLPEHLQRISAVFAGVAEGLTEALPRCAERTVALRKLLEAKDAACRAALD